MGNPENKFTLMMDLCTAPSEGHANVGRLTGAAHLAFKAEDAKEREEEAAKPRLHDLPLLPVPVQTEEDEGRKVCDSSNVWFSEQSCHRGFQLSMQMLRTCRQVYEDAALLPYATNTFHFSGGLHDIFCAAFIKQSSLKQRHAIKTAIVTRLRSRGDNSGRLHTSPNSTSSVSVARPGAIRCCSGPDGAGEPCG